MLFIVELPRHDDAQLPYALYVVDQRLSPPVVIASHNINKFQRCVADRHKWPGGNGARMLSFLRKISIGGRIKDGVPTSDEMEAVEDCLDAKNRGLVSQSDTELKESVYGKFTFQLERKRAD